MHPVENTFCKRSGGGYVLDRSRLRIALITMPWHALDYPSLALGILAHIARHHPAVGDVDVHYGNLRFADFLENVTDGKLTPDQCISISDRYYLKGLGEWVFAPAMFPGGDADAFENDFYSEYGPTADLGPARLARHHSPAFIQSYASEIAAREYDVIGLSTTFMQNVASLALAKAIKDLRPHTTIVFGGGNCDDVQGIALHRLFPFIDFVIRGEAEESFTDLLDALGGTRDVATVSGLCWRDGDSQQVNGMPPPGPLASFVPDYMDYFDQLDACDLRRFVEPKLVLEGSRGCWWGEKHHCKFCGLNGSGMAYRAKPAEVLLEELKTLVGRHQILDVIMSDNIMNHSYINTFAPSLERLGWDMRIHFEVKANLSSAQLEKLVSAGISHLQPGIESLSSKCLSIMDKGTTGTQNVRLLRDAQDLRINVSWNYLFGFPGEEADDYASVVAQMSNLVHLQPPAGASRIALERFSPYFNDPALGFEDKRPSTAFRLIYDLPDKDLRDLVYIFEASPTGLTGEGEAGLQTAVGAWIRGHDRSSFTVRDVESGLLFSDRRVGHERREWLLTDEAEIRMYEMLRDPLTAGALQTRLAGEGLAVSDDRVIEALAAFMNDGAVFQDDGKYVAIATRVLPFRLRLAS